MTSCASNPGAASSCARLDFRTYDDGIASDDHTGSHGGGNRTFHLFGRLPPELRIKIWSYLVRPRIITASYVHRSNSLPKSQGPKQHHPSVAQAPTLLRVCREARLFALQQYELVFGTIQPIEGSLIPKSEWPAPSPPSVWFNFAIDTLWIRGDESGRVGQGSTRREYLPILDFVSQHDLSRVKHLACAISEIGLPEDATCHALPRLMRLLTTCEAAARIPLTISEEEQTRADLKATFGFDALSGTSPQQSALDIIWTGWGFDACGGA